jgi:hypothetical protein
MRFALAVATIAMITPALAQAPTKAVDQFNADMARHEKAVRDFDRYKADHEAWLKADEEALTRRRSELGASQTLTNEREKQNLEFQGKQLQQQQDRNKLEPAQSSPTHK